MRMKPNTRPMRLHGVERIRRIRSSSLKQHFKLKELKQSVHRFRPGKCPWFALEIEDAVTGAVRPGGVIYRNTS